MKQKKKQRRANITPIYYPSISNTTSTLSIPEVTNNPNNCNDDNININNNNNISNTNVNYNNISLIQIDNDLDRSIANSIQITNDILSNPIDNQPFMHHHHLDININNNNTIIQNSIISESNSNVHSQENLINFNNTDEFKQELDRTFQTLENTNNPSTTLHNNNNNNNNANTTSSLDISTEINDVFNNISSIINDNPLTD